MPKKRPLSGAAKDGHERKAARLNDGPIETEIKKFNAKAAPTTASIADAVSKLQAYTKADENDRTDLVLRELLNALPAEGKANLVQDIMGRNDRDLQELGQDVRMFLFTSLKATGARTPTPSRSPSASSAETQAQSSSNLIRKAATTRYGQSSLKKTILKRDANKCYITDLYDTNMANQLPEGEREDLRDDATECAHIIPFSVGPACARGHVDMGDAATKAKTWAFLYRYFPRVRSVVNALSPGSINDPRNAITMVPDMHREFGRFHFGFVNKGVRKILRFIGHDLKATDNNIRKDNEYEIETFRGLPRRQKDYMPPGRRITFSTSTEIELPHPALLDMHLAICRVLHASGMGQEIELILREIEEHDEPTPIFMDRVGEWVMSTS